MKRVYANSQYAKPCERYCREVYPDEAEQIFKKSRGVLSQVLMPAAVSILFLHQKCKPFIFLLSTSEYAIIINNAVKC